MNMNELYDNFMNAGFVELEDDELEKEIGGEWLMKYPLGSVINFIGTVFNAATGDKIRFETFKN